MSSKENGKVVKVSPLGEILETRRQVATPKQPREKNWREFHALSSLTRATLKRPVQSPFPASAHWKPWVRKSAKW